MSTIVLLTTTAHSSFSNHSFFVTAEFVSLRCFALTISSTTPLPTIRVSTNYPVTIACGWIIDSAVK